VYCSVLDLYWTYRLISDTGDFLFFIFPPAAAAAAACLGVSTRWWMRLEGKCPPNQFYLTKERKMKMKTKRKIPLGRTGMSGNGKGRRGSIVNIDRVRWGAEVRWAEVRWNEMRWDEILYTCKRDTHAHDTLTRIPCTGLWYPPPPLHTTPRNNPEKSHRYGLRWFRYFRRFSFSFPFASLLGFIR
jgi:hypothetical protein